MQRITDDQTRASALENYGCSCMSCQYATPLAERRMREAILRQQADRAAATPAREREVYRLALIDLANAIMAWNASDNLNGLGLDAERANEIFNLVNYGAQWQP